ncbi:lipopolysaccharide cholinephosphotransferase [Enterococcus sp. AZ048]|uniref:LicD family protein n=1 Tax=Enterococcus sp. AZ048 TaxID=2774658 RepID=UPI003F25B55E
MNDFFNEIHKKELDIALEFRKICEKYDLKYFMLGGSMLGAIRHNGFIPWDDDIDFGMPRDDYDKFIDLVTNELSKKYNFVSFENTKDYKLFFSKIEDRSYTMIDKSNIKDKIVFPWIDIFPIDGVPEKLVNFWKIRYLYRRAKFQMSQFDNISINRKKRPLHERALINFAKIVNNFDILSEDKEYLKLQNFLKSTPYDSSKYVINGMGAYKLREMALRDWFDELEDIQFEGTKLKGLIKENAELYLTQLYGNYMVLPVLEDRFQHKTEKYKGD